MKKKKDIGLIPGRFSFWPIVLLAFGIYLLVKKKSC